jgi:hypothetical protein
MTTPGSEGRFWISVRHPTRFNLASRQARELYFVKYSCLRRADFKRAIAKPRQLIEAIGAVMQNLH